MDLTYKASSAGHPLIKNPNGTLRLGHWWDTELDLVHYTAYNEQFNDLYDHTLVQDAMDNLATESWITKTSGGELWNYAYLGAKVFEGKPDYLIQEAFGYAQMVLYSFTIPVELQSRIIRKIQITPYGGCTEAEYTGDPPYYVPYVDWPTRTYWNYNAGVVGWRFFDSKPTTPGDVIGSTANSVTLYWDDLTDASRAAGASIIYDDGDNWVGYDNSGWLTLTAPASAKTLLQGKSKIWVCCYPYTYSSFDLTPGYSEYGHQQISESCPFLLRIFA